MRELSPSHERYSLSRTLLGFAPIVTCVALITSASRDHVETRVSALIRAFPLLKCCIADGRTRLPRFKEVPVSYEDLSRAIIRDIDTKTTVQDIFLQEIAARLDVETGPLWRLTFYPHEDSSKNYLAITANHVSTDGKGLANLLQALLSSSELPSTPCLPPKIEERYTVKPQTVTLLKAAFHHFVKPHLPLFLQPADKLFWPTTQAIQKRPATCKDACRVFAIPANIMTKIKQQAKDRQDIKTLHPIIFAVTQLSLLQSIESSQPVLITGSAPIALRPENVSITGNYTGTVNTDVSTSSTASLWELAALHRQALDSSTIASQLDSLGLLAHVPDSPAYVGEATEWETFFGNKLEKQNSFTGTFELSNLGRLVEVDEVWFSQVANPGEEAMHVNVITGSEGNLGVVISYREGSIDEDLMDKMVERFQALLRDVAGE